MLVCWTWIVSIEHPWMPSSFCRQPVRHVSRIYVFLCHQTVGVTDCLRFFDAVVTPVSLFGAGHWTTHNHDLQALDCAFQKLLRKMIRRPASVG